MLKYLTQWQQWAPVISGMLIYVVAEIKSRNPDTVTAKVMVVISSLFLAGLIAVLFWSGAGFVGFTDNEAKAFVAGMGSASGMKGFDYLTDILKTQLKRISGNG